MLFKRYDKEKEINEALEAADQALIYLNNAKKYLSKANNWGLFDILRGGGLVTTMLKHGRIDHAQEELLHAKEAVDVFSEELRDVRGIKNVKINVGKVATFADFMSNRLIVDLYVLSRVRKNKKQTKKAIKKITSIKKELEELKK